MRGKGKRRIVEEEPEMVKIIEEWKEENIRYREKEMEIRIEGETAEDIWRNLKEGVEKCVIRKQVKIKRKKIGERDWWDTECKKEKKKGKRAYKRWRQGKEGKEEYILLRKNFRELCKRKEAAKLEKLEEEIKRARTEAQIWKIVNREKKNARIVGEDISMEEWRRHFVSVLEGREEDGGGKTGKRSLEGDQEEELNDEEIEKQIRKMKRKKAAGADGIAGEAWIYSREKIRTKLKEVLRRVWRGEGFPEEWREGVITPIHKKGDKNKVENYREILYCIQRTKCMRVR